jgi:TonB family protein
MKVSLVLVVALATCALLRRRSAAVRHWVLAAAVLCAAAIPAAERLVPSWSLTVDAPELLRRIGAASGSDDPLLPVAPPALVRAGQRGADDPSLQPPGSGSRDSSNPRPATVLMWLWLAGTAGCLLTLAVGFLRLRSIAARADTIRTGAWADALAEIADEYGLTRPITLLCGPHPGVLVTWGLLRPKVLFPRSALTWDARRIRVVLRHELAHVARRDWGTQLAAEILRSVYWFTPLTWMACRRLRDESEQAADDAVLLRGVQPADYAAHLLDLARSMTHHRRLWAAAPGIARPSSLERRITAMLNRQLDRQPISRAARLTCGALVVSLTAVVASLVFAQGGSARVIGSVSDPSGAPLPDTTISLTHRSTGATHAVPTDQAGSFVFATLPPGEYLLEARAIGFAPVKDTMTLAPGDSTQRDFRLNIGSIEETITVGEPQPGPRPARAKSNADIAGILDRFRGRRLQPPIKLNHVAPTYPTALLEAGVSGQVVLMGRVAADGSVTGIEVVTPAHEDLVTAAIEAARQWKFEPTRLWGTPVEVGMKMTFNFRAQK